MNFLLLRDSGTVRRRRQNPKRSFTSGAIRASAGRSIYSGDSAAAGVPVRMLVLGGR